MAASSNIQGIFNERDIKEINIIKNKQENKLIFTNYRIKFPFGKTESDREIFYNELKDLETRTDEEKEIKYGAQITFVREGRDRKYAFFFKLQEEMEQFKKFYELISIFKQKDELLILKFRELIENTSLLHAYEQMVVKGTVSEQEFW